MGIRTAITRFIKPAPRRERLARRRWQRDTSSLRLLSSAIALVDAEPELAELGEDGLAVAWRIFRPGWNTSRNGPVLFDEIAAELVMTDYREHGARIQVDMDHVSLNKESKAYDPRGLGYHDLELRDDGSLWACNAVWTKRGAECLESDPDKGRAAELPYYSPAFDTDTDLQFGDEPDRVTYIFNGGLVGTPATDRPMALAMAASRHKGQLSMDPKQALKAFRAMSEADRGRLTQIWRLTDSQAALPSVKLAQLLKWQDSPDDVDPKVLAKMVQAMGGDASQGIGGLMRQLRQFMEMAMKALMGEQPAPEAVPTTAEPETMADNPEDKREPEMMAAQRKQADELRQLRRANEERQRQVDELLAERDEGRKERRRAALVKLRLARDPDELFVDPSLDVDKLEPKGTYATMPLDELEAWADKAKPIFDSYPGLITAAPRPASGYSGSVTQPGLFQLSEHEIKRLEHGAKTRGCDLTAARRRYEEVRTMQVKGAADRDQKRLMAARSHSWTDRRHPDARNGRLLLGDETGFFTPDRLEEIRTWAAQDPSADVSSISLIAMAEFDLRYNIRVATPPATWVTVVGDVRASGSIGDTYFPLDFGHVFYQKVTAQAPEGQTPTTWWVDVRKEEYYAAAEADIRLLNEPGSFDYLNDTWLAKSDEMAMARDELKGELAVAIFVDNPLIYVNREKGPLNAGINFFDTAHPIDPFRPETEDINGNTTWSNYQTSATPFTPANLTAEKTLFNMTPNSRGKFFSLPATHVISPTCLTEEVDNKLRVQDLILAGALTADSGAGVGTMGTERSPHTGSGLLGLEIPYLPGATLTADWLLFSAERKARGMVPFVVSESATEETINYDETSDYTKRTRHLRVEKRTFIKVVPMHPWAVRYITGA